MYTHACVYNYVCTYVHACVCIVCVHVYEIMTTLCISDHMISKITGCVRIVSDWIVMGSFSCQKYFCEGEHLFCVKKSF